MIIKRKCDCCGRMFPSTELKLVIIPEKEFDGLACKKCETELKEKEV